MLLDLHSHRPAPYPEGVISLGELGARLMEGQLYSAGIHPWDTATEVAQESWRRLEELAAMKQVVAIGECGVDLTKGAPMFRQLQVFRRQVELSEQVGKPLIIHCVKAADIILGLKRDLNPAQRWIIHGFRGKPELARQLTDKGISLSFGEKFNPDTLLGMPGDMIFAETDESVLTIEEIIGSLSVAANRDLLPLIKGNIAALLGAPLDS